MPGPNAQLKYSPVGLTLTQTFEGCRLTAYRDVRGVWTIGYGHTGPEVVPGLSWTQQQASQALEEDVMWASNAVQNAVQVILNQNQFDALVDFTFNVGIGAFQGSTLLHVLNNSDYVEAASQFGKWIYAGLVISSGLVNRRKAESNLFQTAVS
jgi:lysozyme